jgi:hypothetical protein
MVVKRGQEWSSTSLGTATTPPGCRYLACTSQHQEYWTLARRRLRLALGGCLLMHLLHLELRNLHLEEQYTGVTVLTIPLSPWPGGE